MEYKKTKGQATMTGQLYEIRVAALLYLRCRNNPEIPEFQLATNVEGAGALDDIVLRYKTIHNSQTWRTCFLQLKHKCKGILSDSMLKSPSGDFSLSKYSKSFYEIKEKIMSDGDKEELFNGPFNDCQFLLYTNAKATRELSKRTEDGCLGEIETLLKSESDSAAILGFKEDRDADLLLGLLDINVDNKEFFRKIKTLSGQPTESELVQLIKCELQQCSYVSEDIDTLYRNYEENVTEWWNEKNGRMLSEKSNIYQRAVDKLMAYHIDNMSSQEKKRLCFDIQFQDVKLLENVFPLPVSLLHIVTSKLSPRLSCTKVLQFLEKDSCIFYGLHCLLREQEKALAAWLNGKKNNLVILNEPTSDCFEIGKEICQILKENKLKRIIVVSKRDDKFTNSLKANLVQNYKEIEDVCKMSQLEEKSLQKIKETKVRFQGHRVLLKKLFNEHGQFLQDVFLDDTLIGSAAIGQGLPDVIPYYIPRIVIRHNLIHPDIFHAGLGSVIAVSGATLQELQKMIPFGERVCSANGVIEDNCRFVLLDSVEPVRSFQTFCKTRESVHWLHKDDQFLIWRATQGLIVELKTFVINQRCHRTGVYETDNCFDVNQRCVLLVAQPGMGKTTLVSHIVKQTKEKFPSLWVICINLIDHIALLEKYPCTDIVEFLATALGFTETSFAKSFLKYSIQQTGNAVIVLDGLDEVLPHCESKGFNLLTKLLETKVKKIWVTSRSIINDDLQERLSTLAVQLQPFTEKDQITFLTKYWGDQVQRSLVSDDDLRTLVINLLRRVSHSILDDEIQFTGIPLQTMMLAEVFIDYAKNPMKNPLPEHLNLQNLFEAFVDKKFEIYKQKINVNKVRDRDALTNLKEAYERKHLNASLVYLMSPHQLNELHSKDDIINTTTDFVKRLQAAEDKTGIVDSVTNNIPKFVHRCFAEFFAAKWFSKYYIENHIFIRKYLFTSQNKVILKFLNGMLTRESELHRMVINNDLKGVEKFLAGSNGKNVNLTDLGLRTPLHLAAGGDFKFVYTTKIFPDDLETLVYRDNRFIGPKQRHMVHLLLEYGAEVNMVDKVIESTPLQYALLAGAWDVADLLLAKNANTDDLVFPEDYNSLFTMYRSIADNGFKNLMKCILHRELFTPIELKRDLVERSVMNGHIKLVKLLVEKSEDVKSRRWGGRNLLHQAARCGRKDILEYLLGILKSNVGKDRCGKVIDMKDDFGDTAMGIACLNGWDSIACLLVNSGGNLMIIRNDFSRIFHNSCSNGHLNVIRFVCDHIGNNPKLVQKYIHFVGQNGVSNLALAAANGHIDILKFLVASGADVTKPENNSITALMHVVRRGTLPGVVVLIDSFGDERDSLGKYINRPDNTGSTAMHWCSYFPILNTAVSDMSDNFRNSMTHEKAEITQLLMCRGGDIKVVDNEGSTPLYLSCIYGNTLVAKVLIESFGDNSESVTKFINTPNHWGRTVMHALAASNKIAFNEIYDILNECNDWIVCQRVDLAKLFIANGGDIKSVDIHNKTPLHAIAEQSCSLQVAKVLVGSLKGDRDAVMSYINTRDASGRTAKDYAQAGPRKNDTLSKIQRRAEIANWLDRIIGNNENE